MSSIYMYIYKQQIHDIHNNINNWDLTKFDFFYARKNYDQTINKHRKNILSKNFFHYLRVKLLDRENGYKFDNNI